MKSKSLKADLLLLLTAAIWGFAFVAQRVGNEFVGPFLFNGIRFGLGALCLVPIIMMRWKSSEQKESTVDGKRPTRLWLAGLIAGVILFLGTSLQQVGLIYTTAGKAGFITGLYVVLVPMIGFFARQKVGWTTWIGAILAAVGLFFLSMTGSFTLAPGDGLVLIGALMWAVHVQAIGKFSPGNDPIKLALIQFAVCSILSLVISAIFESNTMQAIYKAWWALLYGSFMSVGIGFTLQVVAQRDAKPSHASIIMSLEAVFAAIGGYLILHELLGLRGLIGCALMLVGMLASQIRRGDPAGRP